MVALSTNKPGRSCLYIRGDLHVRPQTTSDSVSLAAAGAGAQGADVKS
ncbi:hypothetical protein ABZ656_56800 [Streptomyces sp. NPDC007095]